MSLSLEPKLWDKKFCNVLTGVSKWYYRGRLVECQRNGKLYNPPGEKVERENGKTQIQAEIKFLEMQLQPMQANAKQFHDWVEDHLKTASEREREIPDLADKKGMDRVRALRGRADPVYLRKSAGIIEANVMKLERQINGMQREIQEYRKELGEAPSSATTSIVQGAEEEKKD